MSSHVCRANTGAGRSRKRKSHTKSRAGCGNCKIRRVKCDEGKPSCNKCKSYGVSCTYDRISSELQPFEETAFIVNAPLDTPVSVNRIVLATLNEHLRTESGPRAIQLGDGELALLNRFYERTVLTVGHASTRYVYQRQGIKLALRHPFLMHIAITLTMIHDRAHLPASKQSTSEVYHWYEGTSQFNKMLSGPITSSERDAIWITAVLLGCSTLAQIESDTPEQAWPLKEPSPTDLDWIKMSWGKKEAWKIADVYRPDSCLHELRFNHYPNEFLLKPTDHEVFRNLPPELIEFCGLGPDSTSEANPCHTPGAILARLVPIEHNRDNMLKFLTFLGHMPLDFRALLEAKDPRALVIMLWYHSMWLCSNQWWIKRRCVLESQALIIYLERYHSYIPHLQKMLEYPKAAWASRLANESTPAWNRVGSFGVHAPLGY